MPKKPQQEIKKLIHIRLSPDSLMYIKKLGKETCRDMTNVIEYLIFLHSNKILKEPIPYFNAQTKKPVSETHDSTAQVSKLAEEQDTPIFFNDKKENPYAKDD